MPDGGAMMGRTTAIARLLMGVMAVLFCTVRAEAATCSITTTPVAFGTYDVFSSVPTDTTGLVSFSCDGSAVNIVITLNKGGGSGANFSRRRLTGPSDALDYNLYLDAARSTVWGDGTGSTSTYTNASPPNNRAINVTIYGRISAGQDVSAGTYADTVTAIINF
jgi:spore coat protein U-like protein